MFGPLHCILIKLQCKSVSLLIFLVFLSHNILSFSLQNLPHTVDFFLCGGTAEYEMLIFAYVLSCYQLFKTCWFQNNWHNSCCLFCGNPETHSTLMCKLSVCIRDKNYTMFKYEREHSYSLDS